MPNEIIAFDCELTAYRKGSISVHLDLQKGYLTWSESRQWCNNFIRSITEEEILELRTELRSIEALKNTRSHRVETSGAGSGAGKSSQNGTFLTFIWPDRELQLTGDDLDQNNWPSLRNRIEKLSRVPFRL